MTIKLFKVLFIAISCYCAVYNVLYDDTKDLINSFSSDDTITVFNIYDYNIHSLNIGPTYIHIKYFENMEFIDDELIPVRSKNETIKDLLYKLTFKKNNKKKILAVSSYPEASITEKDLICVLKRSYDIVMEDFALLNAPQLYIRNNPIGIYEKENVLRIQFIKTNQRLCLFGKVKIYIGGFLYNSILECFLNEKYTIFRERKVVDDILKFLPLFNVIFDHFENFTEDDWKIEKIFDMNPYSITVQLPESYNYIEITKKTFKIQEYTVFQEICTNALIRYSYAEWRIFIDSIKNFKQPDMHAITLIYLMIKSDDKALKMIIKNMTTSVDSFHFWALLCIIYFTEIMNLREISKFAQDSIYKFNKQETYIDSFNADDLLAKLRLKKYKLLYNFFIALVVDRLKILMDINLFGMNYPSIELIYKLTKSVERIKIDKDPLDSSKYLATFYVTNDNEVGSQMVSIFKNIFINFDVFKIIKNEIVYGSLYILNKSFLQNDKLNLYSYFHCLKRNASEEEKLKLEYEKFVTN